jgi:hypothetical protein
MTEETKRPPYLVMRKGRMTKSEIRAMYASMSSIVGFMPRTSPLASPAQGQTSPTETPATSPHAPKPSEVP